MTVRPSPPSRPAVDRAIQQRFEVTPLSAERRQGIRNAKLQNELAQETGGRTYDLTTVHNLVKDLELRPVIERQTRSQALWTTPLWFAAVVLLMLGEWLSRKMIKLS